MPTLKDIAARCGTSTATVSYVLSGRGTEKRISPEMQAQIKEVAEAMDYAPKGRMRSALKYRVAVYLPLNDLKMLLPTFWDGFNNAVNVETAHIDIIMRPYEQNKLHLQRELWSEGKNIAALVISPGGLDLASLTETPATVPVILLNRTLPNYSSVSVDQLESGRMAAKHAMKKGGDDIILVSSKSLFGVTWRGNAFIDCCRSNGVSLDNRIYYADTDITAGYELGKHLIAAGKLAKVIVCAYDMTALGISSALTEAGIAVGREVQIIVMCSSNEKLFEHYTPPITAVDLRFRDACQMAMHLAMDIATGRASYPQDISIRPVMIYRKSCPM